MAWFLVVLGVALVAGGLWYRQSGNARHARATAGWTQGQARIVHAEAREVTSTDSDGNDTTAYRPTISYTYQAGGTERQGTRAFLHNVPDMSRAKAESWAAQYPAGATVPVWYDASKPEDAALVLNKPSAVAIFVFLVVGLGLAVFGLFLVGKS